MCLMIIFIIVSILVLRLLEMAKSELGILIGIPKGRNDKRSIFPRNCWNSYYDNNYGCCSSPFWLITAIYLAEYANENLLLPRLSGLQWKTCSCSFDNFRFVWFRILYWFCGKNLDSLLSGGELRWAQPNILWASLTMALLTLPVVIVLLRAIRTIHVICAKQAFSWRNKMADYKKSGAARIAFRDINRYNPCRKPCAGEVAPILFTGAVYFSSHLPHSLSDQFMSLGYHIYIMSTQSSNVDATQPIQFATTLVCYY